MQQKSNHWSEKKSVQIFTDIQYIVLKPLPPSNAVLKQKFILDPPVQYCHNFKKKYHPSGNLEFNNLGNFQSLALRLLVEKILPISLKLNFTSDTWAVMC